MGLTAVRLPCWMVRRRGRGWQRLRPLLLAALAAPLAGCTVHLHLSEKEYVYHVPVAPAAADAHDTAAADAPQPEASH